RLQYIFGVDYLWNDIITVGYQLHHRELPSLHWNSFFTQYVLNDSWQFDLFAFIGINNDDVWLQPKATYRWKNAFVSFQYDVLDGSEERPGIFALYKDKDRFFTNIGYKF